MVRKSLYGIDVTIQNVAPLEPEYIPIKKWMDAYLAAAKRPVAIAIEREAGKTAVFHSFIRANEASSEADLFYLSKFIKMLLWAVGGFRITLAGCDEYVDLLARQYTAEGARAFDWDFMNTVYGTPPVIVRGEMEHLPPERGAVMSIGKHLDGCRIGFDAGGSDRKVSAVIDGETVYSEEVIWYPKLTENPDYHFEEIVTAFKTAAAHMPRVDAIGVSSAGVYIDNEVKVASLFLKVPQKLFAQKVTNIYKEAARCVAPGVPLIVANDGDVSALAGAMSLESGNVMGLAMGTSEAVGYVDAQENVTGWLNELAFAPVDMNPEAFVDEWSGDRGVGCKYFSQDAVIRLALRAGIVLPEEPLAQQLKFVQQLMQEDEQKAAAIFESIGVYLGHTLAYYADFYALKHIILMGRVVSGRGGELILENCRRTLNEEYPQLAGQICVALPDERMRRVGQSVAAASLPDLA